MLWTYIQENYAPCEPIIASDIDIGFSDNNRRQQFKNLTDSGKLRRYENGIYYIPQKSRLGIEIKPPAEIIARYKYISRNKKVIGYYSGYTFANKIGISSQVPFVQEIVSNDIGTAVKPISMGNCSFIIRKSRTEVTKDNVKILQFLDLLKDLDLYSELPKDMLKQRLVQYILQNEISKDAIDKYISLYPDKIYKSIYEMGIINVFT